MDNTLYHGEGRDTVDYRICIFNVLHNSLKKKSACFSFLVGKLSGDLRHRQTFYLSYAKAEGLGLAFFQSLNSIPLPRLLLVWGQAQKQMAH